MDFILRLLTDEQVAKKYVESGKEMGKYNIIKQGKKEDISDKIINDWNKWEQEYARRGYRTISLDNFTKIQAYNKNPEGLLFRELKNPVLYAKIYQFIEDMNKEIDQAVLNYQKKK